LVSEPTRDAQNPSANIRPAGIPTHSTEEAVTRADNSTNKEEAVTRVDNSANKEEAVTSAYISIGSSRPTSNGYSLAGGGKIGQAAAAVSRIEATQRMPPVGSATLSAVSQRSFLNKSFLQE
jgi:hypothetical protein